VVAHLDLDLLTDKLPLQLVDGFRLALLHASTRHSILSVICMFGLAHHVDLHT
jgi:hypothetical protein